MSDFNTTIVAIDSGIDCFSRIRDSASQFDKVVRYDLSQLGDSIAEQLNYLERRLDSINDQLTAMSDVEDGDTSHQYESQALLEESDRLRKKMERLEELQDRFYCLVERYNSQAGPLLGTINLFVSDGIRDMAQYLQKIQSVEGFQIGNSAGVERAFANPFSNDSDYAVVIVDSSKYPETAEHIDAAVRSGYPAILTLSRDSANNNRNASLQDVPVRHDFDRDEWPMACFAEGGNDAHVFYLTASDNRGSGSSVSHQLRNVTDGTRVRFRIV